MRKDFHNTFHSDICFVLSIGKAKYKDIMHRTLVSHALFITSLTSPCEQLKKGLK